MTTIGLLHPGEMGADIGGVLVRSGHEVLWTSLGRSTASVRRAQGAGLVDAGSLEELLDRAEVVFSICPPHAAIEVAESVAGFRGRYVDANAISPSHAEQVTAILESCGARCVDGGIIGLPSPSDMTQLSLSGPEAESIAALFSNGEIDVRVLTGDRFAASALKMAYAAWSKGTAAMMLNIRALARANGVEAELLSAWEESSPDLLSAGPRAARQAEERGWRWAGEMAEIASTFLAAGLPGGFHQAAEEIYRRSPRQEAVQASDETLDEVLNALLGRA